MIISGAELPYMVTKRKCKDFVRAFKRFFLFFYHSRIPEKCSWHCGSA
ncbi:hypothetical protein HMPREF1981_00008 [Bacteroides pyogenes F0041]|uniref:Uncharacterized protein n=1 Tax=Bacteroides pyogenes F0041 TaxID=1321819 RepID=U2E521_9BACE|nr:hypothetical protein HMPREF1981_00008 [Bacteroides pyogenes F0041]